MTKPTIKIHNVESDEIIEREMTDAELVQWEKDLADIETRKQAQAEAENKKTAAEAKLAALGLTTDDLKALGLN